MQELFFLSAFLYFATEGAPYTRYSIGEDDPEVKSILVDMGTNYTLSCGGYLRNVMWIHHSYDTTMAKTTKIQEDGSLFFPNIQESDSGLWTCHPESDSDEDIMDSRLKKNEPHSASVSEDYPETRVRLRVRTPPLTLKNVTVLPSTILASVIWENGEDGGYPISSFQLRYRLKNSSEDDWSIFQPNPIAPTRRHLDIFHLNPNSSYVFEIWANNHLGKGSSTRVEISTHNDQQEIEVGKYLLEGVDTFDTRAWVVAVGVVLGTLLILGVATCCLFYKEYSLSWLETAAAAAGGSSRDDSDGESIELMPNIILNPTYDFQSMELLEPDENSNDTTPLRVNNNSVIFPTRV